MTPLMQQYQRIKSKCPDAILFFHLGDFYEMFHDDAVTASKVLGLTLTSRQKGEGAIPMAGVPCHAMDGYLRRLVQAGHKVAICEQMQEPGPGVDLVERDITRIVTPGTITEPAALDARKPNHLLAVLPADGRDATPSGMAWVDLSTGAFEVGEAPPAEIPGAAGRIAPVECLLPEEASALGDILRKHFPCRITLLPAWHFGRDTARKRLHEHFKVKSLDGFGCAGLTTALSAAGALLYYLQETQRGNLPHINRIVRRRDDDTMVIDRSTRHALELLETARTGERQGSLLAVLDFTLTPMGGRLLRERITAPFRHLTDITARQEAVEELVRGEPFRARIRDEALRPIQDLERLAMRIACGRAGPKDLAASRDSFAALPALKTILTGAASAHLKLLAKGMDDLGDLRKTLEKSLNDDVPFLLSDGNVIRRGHDSELDELRDMATTGKTWIAGFQRREIERTGIATLKIGFNQVFGYYIEITHTHRAKIPSDYTRKQTLKNAERYVTPELKEYETKVLSADEKAKAIEKRLFEALRAALGKETSRIQAAARAVAEADVTAALAEAAARHRYIRPVMTDEPVLDVEEARHPVLEQLLAGEPFVPNDIRLDRDSSRTVIITGPNMAGKSTYIRQAALLVVMAQMGGFVPAKRAVLGVADRVFTRIGASDDLVRGQSTFMVEMLEAANIINNATEKSLIILDEIGRGTSTYDGVSLAWAIAEHIHERIRARTLFATHFHELSDLAADHPGIRNANVAVKEWGDDIIFLRKIEDGATDRSYGLHVARLAGVPREVLDRAKAILAKLEASAPDIGVGETPGRGKASGRRGKIPGVQFSLFGPAPAKTHPVIAEILRTDVHRLTPLQAMAKIAEWRERASGEKGKGAENV
ncbi:MAG: DNA mismatch repair protein MutS [Planctomycetota bacterium]